MMRTSKAVVFLLALSLVFALSACATNQDAQPGDTKGRNERTDKPKEPSSDQEHPGATEGLSQLWVGDEELWLEVAHDSASRGRGLSGRMKLSERQGMVFLYGMSEDRSFWMKNTWVPLDVAFVDDDMTITRIVSLDPPAPDCADVDMPRAKSQGPARHVVEMSKGWFKAHGLGAGSSVRFSPELSDIAKGIEF
ncbi:MAG: uncharacterized membrane protein (UPF0127 family) [Planctomycetota bacterium]|jgi:uncharacterized membrane protein (UPF0127 family)